MKKILKSAGGSNTNRLRAPMWYIHLWRSPPPETFIIYDGSSSPSADDYLVLLRRIIRAKPTYKKIQP